MPKPKSDGPTKTFQVRMSGEKAEQWLRLFQLAKNRSPYISEAAFNRLLLGFDTDPRTITEHERQEFLGQPTGQAELVGRLTRSKTRIKAASPKRKQK